MTRDPHTDGGGDADADTDRPRGDHSGGSDGGHESGHGHDHGDGQDGAGHGHGHGHGDDRGEAEHDHGHGHGEIPSTVSYAVVTVSSSRTVEEDGAGDAVVATVEAAGGEVVHRELVPDDYDRVQATVDHVADRDDVDAVVTLGGTGVTPDDVTVEAVRPLFRKELPGFGELFRALSRESVGTATIASRATAGIVERTPVFCLPGSEDAARLGSDEIVVREAAHLVGLARR